MCVRFVGLDFRSVGATQQLVEHVVEISLLGVPARDGTKHQDLTVNERGVGCSTHAWMEAAWCSLRPKGSGEDRCRKWRRAAEAMVWESVGDKAEACLSRG